MSACPSEAGAHSNENIRPMLPLCGSGRGLALPLKHSRFLSTYSECFQAR